MNSPTRRDCVRIGIGILFSCAALIHFTHPELFEQLVPAALQNYRGIVNTLTGMLILAMGVAFLVPRLRAVARWSAIALLIVTLPAAVDRVIHPAAIESMGFTQMLAAVEVLVWLIMIALIWWATKPKTDGRNA